MSELRSAVEAYRSEVLSELPDAQVEEDFTELWRARELLETECLRRLPDLERRGIFERDGHLSAASWLASRFTLAWGAARELARMARGLREMPGTRAALADGKLSTSAAKVLVATREADPAAFGEAESMLVEAALIHTMGDLRKVTDYWRQLVERQRGLEGDEGLGAQRRLHLSVTFLNTVKLDGLCDPETGEHPHGRQRRAGRRGPEPRPR